MLRKTIAIILFILLGIVLMKVADYAVESYQTELSNEWQEFFAKHDCKLVEVYVGSDRRGFVCDDGIEYYIDDPKFRHPNSIKPNKDNNKPIQVPPELMLLPPGHHRR